MDKKGKSGRDGMISGQAIRKVAKRIHDVGGCGAEDEYSEGCDDGQIYLLWKKMGICSLWMAAICRACWDMSNRWNREKLFWCWDNEQTVWTM